MTWNGDEKYPRGWDNESVYPSLLHWKADWRDVPISPEWPSYSHASSTSLSTYCSYS